MRTAICIAIALASAAAAAKEQPVLETDSGAIQADGDAVSILRRAKVCVAQLVRFDPVQIQDSASGNTALGALANANTAEDNRSVIPGGDVIIDYSEAPTSLVARERLRLSQLLGDHIIQSTITLQAKEGKFRILRAPVELIEVNTGLLANDGKPLPVYLNTRVGTKAKQALADDDQKISACIAAKTGNW